MDNLELFFSRRSVREYSERRISDEDLRAILAAGMSGPSCADTRPWQFIVVKDRETLGHMADANGKYAAPLRNAAVGILICGDLDRAFPGAREYWVIDGTIAGQNMTLAAKALGIGSVWLGTWPQMDRVEKQRSLFGLPESIVPHSIIAFGYPAEDNAAEPREAYEESRVHFEKW